MVNGMVPPVEESTSTCSRWGSAAPRLHGAKEHPRLHIPPGARAGLRRSRPPRGSAARTLTPTLSQPPAPNREREPLSRSVFVQGSLSRQDERGLAPSVLLPVALLRSVSPEVVTFRDPGRRKNTCATLSA